MKRIFKLMLLIFSCMLFISKSLGFTVAGSRYYAYVSGNFGESALLTRYQIDSNENLIKPVTIHLVIPGHKDKVSGIAIAPDHHYIYVAYGTGILRIHLNNDDRNLDMANIKYYKIKDTFNFCTMSLAVSVRYHKLYFIANRPFNRKVYSFDINEIDNDDLINFRELSGPLIPRVDHARLSVNKGISVANDGTIFVNTMVVSDDSLSHLVINILPVDHNGDIIESSSVTFDRQDGQNVGGSKYISKVGGVDDVDGLLVMSEEKSGLATICRISPRNRVKPCLEVSNHANFSFDHPTYDVDVNPDWPTLYFTSGNQIFRWDLDHEDRAPVSMRFTRGIPSEYIVTF